MKGLTKKDKEFYEIAKFYGSKIDREKGLVECQGCGKMVVEVCPSGCHCRDCHVSCSWEDCLTGEFEERQMRKSAMRIGRKCPP